MESFSTISHGTSVTPFFVSIISPDSPSDSPNASLLVQMVTFRHYFHKQGKGVGEIKVEKRETGLKFPYLPHRGISSEATDNQQHGATEQNVAQTVARLTSSSVEFERQPCLVVTFCSEQKAGARTAQSRKHFPRARKHFCSEQKVTTVEAGRQRKQTKTSNFVIPLYYHGYDL